MRLVINSHFFLFLTFLGLNFSKLSGAFQDSHTSQAQLNGSESIYVSAIYDLGNVEFSAVRSVP